MKIKRNFQVGVVKIPLLRRVQNVEDPYLHDQYDYDSIDPSFDVTPSLNTHKSNNRYAYANEYKALSYRHRFGIAVKEESDNNLLSNDSYYNGISWVLCEKINGIELMIVQFCTYPH